MEGLGLDGIEVRKAEVVFELRLLEDRGWERLEVKELGVWEMFFWQNDTCIQIYSIYN